MRHDTIRLKLSLSLHHVCGYKWSEANSTEYLDSIIIIPKLLKHSTQHAKLNIVMDSTQLRQRDVRVDEGMYTHTPTE